MRSHTVTTAKWDFEMGKWSWTHWVLASKFWDNHTCRHHTSFIPRFSSTKLPPLPSCRFSLAKILKQSKSYKGPCYCHLHKHLILWTHLSECGNCQILLAYLHTCSKQPAFDAGKCAEIVQTYWPISNPTNTGYISDHHHQTFDESTASLVHVCSFQIILDHFIFR